jgi:hypothetical protein
MTMKDDRHIITPTFVYGVSEKDASLIAVGRVPIVKNGYRA